MVIMRVFCYCQSNVCISHSDVCFRHDWFCLFTIDLFYSAHIFYMFLQKVETNISAETNKTQNKNNKKMSCAAHSHEYLRSHNLT